MPTLTLMPGGEAPGAQSQYLPDCPNWVLVVIYDQEIAIESWCGRYFEWLDNQGDDVAELIADADCSTLEDGLYVVEGQVSTESGAAAEWIFERIRSLEPAEWQRYREGGDVWDPKHLDPAFVELAVDETASEFQALLDAGKGWLEWRRTLGIDLSAVEIQLMAAIHALTDEEESDGLSRVP